MNKLTSLCFAIVLIATSCKKEDASTLDPIGTTPYSYRADFADYGEVTFVDRDGVQVERATVVFGRGVILTESQTASISARSMDRYVSLPDGNFRVFLQVPDSANGYNQEWWSTFGWSASSYGNAVWCPYTWTDGQNLVHQDTLIGSEIDRFTNWYAYDQDWTTVSVESNGLTSTVNGNGTASVTLP